MIRKTWSVSWRRILPRLIDLIISVITMCMGFGGVVVGGFGMSEAVNAADEPLWFNRILYGTFVTMVVMIITVLLAFFKLRLFN